ncbi:MAG: GNAT family N-acetyltransferase [Gemmatimonadetes bacterium]|nr:GNAT family N-acetyltransferase [Gemmatimonadota bacterium]
MSPPEGVRGPLRLEGGHIDELNRVFSESFTERYHRDGMTGVRVPQLNPVVWRYAIDSAGDGAMHWRDDTGAMVAFNLAHASGREGWMGPLAVRPDWQARRLGRTIVTEGIRYLEGRGCTTLGLETMPRTVDNIGFYSRLGFRPGHLTVSLVREVGRAPIAAGARPAPAGDREGLIEEARALVDGLAPGLDFSREARLTLDRSLGDVTMVRHGGRPRALAIWHSVPLAAGRSADEIRILKLAAADSTGFKEVVRGVIREAAARGLGRVGIRCQAGFRAAYGDLIDLGFKVHWTDLRMLYDDRLEPAVPPGAVIFSNWEI